MATTTVYELLNRCRTQLMETTTEGTRWTNDELLVWLGEFYQLACLHMPGDFSEVREITCEAGTKQTLPSDMTRLLDVTRNADGSMRAVRRTMRNIMDATRPNWHSETLSTTQEVWCMDDQFPRTFYVSPPATEESKLEIVGAIVPTAHVISDYTGAVTTIKCSDQLAPAAVDYILSRCYGKDADFSGNAARQQNHYNLCMTAMGVNSQVKIQSSPNNPANNQ